MSMCVLAISNVFPETFETMGKVIFLPLRIICAGKLILLFQTVHIVHKGRERVESSTIDSSVSLPLYEPDEDLHGAKENILQLRRNPP